MIHVSYPSLEKESILLAKKTCKSLLRDLENLRENPGARSFTMLSESMEEKLTDLIITLSFSTLSQKTF